MKTTSEIYEQWERVFRLYMRAGRRRAATAHPATGGDELLVHNWGNEASRAAWARTWEQAARARVIFKRLYDEADRRSHGRGFRPLWCAACQAGAR